MRGISSPSTTGTTPIGETTVQPGGTWTWTPPESLPNGTYDLSLTVTNSDGAGNESAPSQPVSITIDTDAPTAPGLPVVTDNVSDITGPVGNNGATNDTRPVLSGTGTPDDVISIYDQTTTGNVLVGRSGSGYQRQLDMAFRDAAGRGVAQLHPHCHR
ncbi:Uncharacterised protein [Leclercia adecarboxylata]|uniref:Bacterial Ig-like domain-containing protein n=1 Tax=Leclercia adecarboxylata TaxID=83655 RepID=A0A4U9IE88_9ENTR|nr:Uncharacterised protein [Leclercia adecarboxylata]